MAFPFTRDEVRAHLKDFGLENVSEKKLDEFMADLKRLVKYDEKQQDRGKIFFKYFYLKLESTYFDKFLRSLRNSTCFRGHSSNT